MSTSTMQDEIECVESELRRWLRETGIASHDPYDALACRPPWSLVRRWRLPARAWTQLVKASPVNLRPLFGIPKRVQSKSLSDLASAALLRHRLRGDAAALAEARDLLERLREAACPGRSGACWGLANPYVTRYARADANDPNLFQTLNAATAFVEAWELERRPEDLATARSALEFALRDLGWEDDGEGGVWFHYFVGHAATVFNVTALCGALLQRVAPRTGEPELEALGGRALRFVVRHQNPDGSWFYERGSQGRWVDGFHTGYVLEALLQSMLTGTDGETRASFERGVDFYLRSMFTPQHLPRYAADRTWPIEVQNCAQAIQTLSKLCWHDRRHLDLAERVARAVIARLYRRTGEGTGYFAMSRGRALTNTLPAVRWGQAPMLLALSHLLAARAGLPPSWELVPRCGA